MSIRHGILAMLAESPRHGYQLRQEFETMTGSTWPLNVGQVYTTLARLERDGLVVADGDPDGPSHSYALTDAGRRELLAWFATPVRREDRPRDELAIKLAMAATVADVEVADVVQAQRTDTMRALQDYTRLRATPTTGPEVDELAWQMVLDSLVFAAEAELRWLDACEQRLARRTRSPRPTGPVSAPDETPVRHPGAAAGRQR